MTPSTIDIPILRRTARVACLFLVAAAAGCGREYPTRLAEGTHEVPTGRPLDNLLERPDLQKLVELRIAKKADSLTAALTAFDPTIRARAAFELASLIDPISAPGLLTALEDEEAAVRRDVAFALGQYGPSAIESALGSPGPGREAVLALLDRLGRGAEANRLRAAMAVTPIDPSVVTQAAEDVSDALGVRLIEVAAAEPVREVRNHLLRAAPRVGAEETLESLLAFVPNGVEDRRLTALGISYLMRRDIESREGFRRLSEYLKDSDPDVRVKAAYGFRWAQDPRLWRPFLGDIRATMASWSAREPAAQQMVGGIERSELVDDHVEIMRFLREAPDWRVRANAANALNGWENQPEQRRHLLDALSDPSEHVAIASARALSNSPPPLVFRRQLENWIEHHPDRTLVGAYLLEGIISNDGTPFAVDWLESFPTTRVVEWVVGLNSLAILAHEEVLEAVRRGAIAESRALGISATADLVRRWEQFREAERTHDWFYETFRQIWETGDPERRELIRELLLEPAFADRPDLVGDFELEGAIEVDHPLEIDWEELTELGRHPRMVLETDEGRIVLVLDTEEAPLTVQWMTRFAREGYLDGVPFHRVEQNFVIQGGNTSMAEGGRSLRFRMQTEATQIPYVRGTLGMARSARDTESSQLFITHTMSPHLFGDYTAWGWVAEGMHVVDRIQRFDRILHATVIPDTR